MQRLSRIHQEHYGTKKAMLPQELQEVLNAMRSRLGAEALLTPGELVRDFTGILNVLQQNPQLNLNQVLQQESKKVCEPQPSSDRIKVSKEFAEFTL